MPITLIHVINSAISPVMQASDRIWPAVQLMSPRDRSPASHLGRDEALTIADGAARDRRHLLLAVKAA